jgi:hypothetical protein
MNPVDVLGAPVDEGDDLPEFPPAPCFEPPPPETVPGPGPDHRLRIAALVAALALAGFAGGAYLGRTSPRQLTDGAIPAPPAEVLEFAGFFVSVHLGGRADPSDVADLYAGAAPLLSPEQTNTWVSRAAAVAAIPVADRIWKITVAADILERIDGIYRQIGIEYFALIVADRDAGPVALTAPARVPAPGSAAARSGSDAPLTAAQAAAAESALEAYLVGNDGSSAAPYERIEITQLAGDGVGGVAAIVVATDRYGAEHSLEYEFELVRTEGGWRVDGLQVPTGAAP